MGKSALAGVVVAIGCGLAPIRVAAQPSVCLLSAGSAAATSRECLACHGGRRANAVEAAEAGARPAAVLAHTHPVDVDYARSARRPRARLRDPAEVVRRGAFLPDGLVRCGTCHDGRSQAQFRLWLPADARLPSAAAALGGQQETIDPTPLCTVCHAVGEM